LTVEINTKSKMNFSENSLRSHLDLRNEGNTGMIDDRHATLWHHRAVGVHHRRMPSSDNVSQKPVGQVAPQALPDKWR